MKKMKKIIYFRCCKKLAWSLKYEIWYSIYSVVVKYSSNGYGLANRYSNPASILRKSTSSRHRPVSYPDGPMTARYRFT